MTKKQNQEYSRKIKVIGIQQTCFEDKQASFAQTEKWIQQASQLNPDLIVLQELHATQYFCQTEETRFFDLAEPLDGLTAQFLSAQDRDTAYLDAMRALNQQYPTDPDIAALYAGAYMSIGRWNYWDSAGNPRSETAEVAAALERVIATGRQHPGVFHLHIHLIEASNEPERALVSANALEATML